MPGQQVVVQGRPGVRDVILITASGATVQGMTVTGCVPNPAPRRFEDDGSSDIRIDDNTTGVTVAGMTVTSSRGTNSCGLPFGCYGVFAHGADPVAAKLVVQGNRFAATGPYFAVHNDGTSSPTLADWQARTGQDVASVTFDDAPTGEPPGSGDSQPHAGRS